MKKIGIKNVGALFKQCGHFCSKLDFYVNIFLKKVNEFF